MRHLTYSNVMATIAVFIALGGTSYAVIKLPRNSVGTTQLKRNSVTGAKVRPSAIGLRELSSKAEARRRGPRGAQGPAGAAGAPGARGPSEGRFTAGPSGVLDLPRAPNVNALGARLTGLAPGSWLVMFSGEISFEHPGALIATCVALVDGVEVAGTNGIFGSSGATRAMPLSAFGGVTKTATFDVTLQCRQNTAIGADQPPVRLSNRSFAAIRVEDLKTE